jgi:hypothetical protein
MVRNKRHFRPLFSRLSEEAWGGIFGQCAVWLTESPALSDRERLKRRFAAYWALSSAVVQRACCADRVSPEVQTELRVQKCQLREFCVRESAPPIPQPTDNESALHA